MDDRYIGRLTLPDGEETDVEIAFDDDTVTLSIEGADVGSWPLRFCRVSRGPHDLFTLSLDGEVVGFQPAQLHGFGLAAAQRFRFSNLADRVRVIRELPPEVEPVVLPEPEPEQPARRGIPWRFLPLALVVLGTGILATLYLGAGDDAPPSSVTDSSTSTIAPAPVRSLFDLTPGELVDQWNQLAPELGAPAPISPPPPDGPFEVEIAPGIILQGRLSADGTVESLVVSAMSGVDEGLLQPAIDVAIATADPLLDPGGRRRVIADVGLAGGRPAEEGGETEIRGIRYALTRLEGIGSTLFTITRA